MTPLVSVVIPCYNHECFIQETIQSIIDQTYERIELIIVDDGSKDQSFTKIQEMASIYEKRFERVYFNTRPNQGLCITLNEGLALCKGKYVCLIASDDVMLPNKTQLQVDYLENNLSVAGVFGGIYLINDFGDIIGERVSLKTEYTFDEVLLSQHDLPALTQMYRLSIIKEVGAYDENIKIEDWDIILRLLKNKKILKYIPESIAKYRIHDNNFSKDSLRMANEMLKVLQKFSGEKLYPYVSYRLNRTILRANFKINSPIKYYIMKIKNWIKYVLKQF